MGFILLHLAQSCEVVNGGKLKGGKLKVLDH